jgi:DUF4097 and DUF4098 domain-containing protein YvlB
MKEEVRRIMKLVQEGKLSPEDAADLIDAFGDAEKVQEAVADKVAGSSGSAGSAGSAGTEGSAGTPTGESKKDSVKSFVEFMEGIGKEVSESVNWHDVARQIRDSVKKGVVTAKISVENMKKGGGFFGAHEDKEITLPLSIIDGKTLKVENTSGDIKIVGGQTQSKAVAHATLRAADPAEAKRKAEEYTLVIEESENAVIIRQPNIGGLSVDLEVWLAVKAPVEVRTQAGDVSILDTGMSARVTSQSGDAHLRGLDGNVEVVSQNGDLTIEDVKSPSLSIENKAGDVVVRRFEGNLTTRSASGDVRLMACSAGTVSVESVSGDVNVDMSEPVTKTMNIRTVNGDAMITVPDGCDCRVSLSTLRGDVDCDVKLEDEAKLDQHLTGRLGEGAGTMDVSAVNGDITLKLRAEVVTETA